MNHIPMLDLARQYRYMKKDIDAAIARCLEHQRWIKGPEVEELERRMAEYLGVGHCIGVASGTDALVIALRALAMKTKGKEYFCREDEIITTPFTFVATGEAILRSGATPVFVDIDPSTLNIDAAKIEEYLASDAERAVGILPVHLYGQACDMDAILDIAGKYDLFVLEDAAQALGGAWDGRRLAGIGHAGALSFFPSKNLGCFGDGGMIATSDEELAEISRMLLQHGGKDKYRSEHIGYNSRLDTLQAAVLLAKFPYLEEMLEGRRRVAAIYEEGLEGIAGIRLLEHAAKALPTYNQYTILVEGGKRDEMAGHLREKGVSTAVYYHTPLHRMEVFEGRSRMYGELTHALKASKEVLSFPVDPLLRMEDARRVVKTVRLWANNHV